MSATVTAAALDEPMSAMVVAAALDYISSGVQIGCLRYKAGYRLETGFRGTYI